MKKYLLIGLMLTLPVLFMMGIFQFGKDLKAPKEIHGTWQMSITGDNLKSPSCNLTSILGKSPKFSILQSGKFIHMSFDSKTETLLKGNLNQENLVLKNNMMTLDATIDQHNGLVSMQGQVKLADCDELIPFSAQMDSINEGDVWTQ